MFSLLLAIIYLSFISLGLPDSLLGAAWPSIYPQLQVPISYMGMISMIIALGTIVSSLQSDRLARRFGTGMVTAISVGMTAVALFGFSVSSTYLQLCLWAIPYGLGAGSVDASLNNYVALHYESRHMSWLHCMWGVGATIGPYIMGLVLGAGLEWNAGYRIISIIQLLLTAILLFSLPLWKTRNSTSSAKEMGEKGRVLSLREILNISGVKEVMICFFCYCAVEQTTGLWVSSYLTLHKGLASDQAAGFASLFFIGITIGRALSGFLTLKFNDKQMVRLGQLVMGIGMVILILPFDARISLSGLITIGLGCAPIYPSIIHSTPEHFGPEHSQAIIGVQMASAYVGTLAMPPLFGLIAQNLSLSLLPLYLFAILLVMFYMHEKLNRKTLKIK